MDKGYVSEFTVFINCYLAEHPKVVEEKMRGWNFFWNPKIDPKALDKTNEDIVPDDHYGFASLFGTPGHKAEKHPKNQGTVK